MNAYFAAAVAALALVGSADAVACTTAQQQGAYLSLIGLLTGKSLMPCANDSGYNMLYAKALPTDAQMIAMCGVAACHQLIIDVSAANPPDCDLNIPTSGAVMNVYELATTFESDCTALISTTAPPTDAPTTAPVVTDAPTDAPVVTDTPTDAPVVTDTPTDAPVVTEAPTDAPVVTDTPTDAPVVTEAPTDAPVVTDTPTDAPVVTDTPTDAPVVTDTPTTAPVITDPPLAPTDEPVYPTDPPTETPSTTEPVTPGASC
ncbi:hypothetical protein BBJ28_00015254 [Nothophytophthora sp. Chile5]|nr:hypothetical protein BBJ28_00015254 [Nothophytophthora sp. Chile5]